MNVKLPCPRSCSTRLSSTNALAGDPAVDPAGDPAGTPTSSIIQSSSLSNKLLRTPLSIVFLVLVPWVFFVGCDQQVENGDPAFPYLEMTVDDFRAGYQAGDFTVSEVVEAYIGRIEAIDQHGPSLNSIRYVNPNAMAEAAERDKDLREGRSLGVLHGIPVLLKDNINTKDMPTTAGSVLLDGSVPPDDAFIVKKLREQGAVILGKTNLSEWANFHSSFSSSGWSSLGGQVKNPYDLSRNPCGSSSGSGVAASANLAALTIGTETNGSIVCPSSANGIVGLKPTVGLWSRSGIIPISYTTDSAGPMTRTVRDAAILLGALAGVDTADGKTMLADHPFAEVSSVRGEGVGELDEGEGGEDNGEGEGDGGEDNGEGEGVGEGDERIDYTIFLNEDGLRGKRLGFYTAPRGSHFRVDEQMEAAIEVLKAGGAEIIEIPQIALKNVGGDAFTVLLNEFHDGLDTYFSTLGDDSVPRSFDELVAWSESEEADEYPFDYSLIRQAKEASVKADAEGGFEDALARMLRVSRDEGIDRVMAEHSLNALFSYTGSPAWKTDLTLGDNFQLASSSPSARAGYPVITVPMGTIDGLPMGISFFGPAWSEPVLLEIAYAFEQKSSHRLPPSFLRGDESN